MRYLHHACSNCGHVDPIDWALLFACPACRAPSGQPCQDLRHRQYRVNGRVHGERRELVDRFTEESRAALRRALQPAS